MKRKVVCPVCGKLFTAGRITQKYCSAACRRYAVRHGMIGHDAAGQHESIMRTFHCLRCGVLVTVKSPTDRRIKFCSAHCERLYWKHSKHSNRVKSVAVTRAFHCRQCGALVEVTDAADRRTAFCSAACRIRWTSLHRKRNTHTKRSTNHKE